MFCMKLMSRVQLMLGSQGLKISVCVIFPIPIISYKLLLFLQICSKFRIEMLGVAVLIFPVCDLCEIKKKLSIVYKSGQVDTCCQSELYIYVTMQEPAHFFFVETT